MFVFICMCFVFADLDVLFAVFKYKITDYIYAEVAILKIILPNQPPFFLHHLFFILQQNSTSLCFI